MGDASLQKTLDRGELDYLSPAMQALLIGSGLVARIGPRTVQTGVVVYADVNTTDIDGIVLAVHATAAGLVGHKDIVPYGTVPAAGQCSLHVDATTGKTTVLFANADLVTAITVEMIKTGPAYRALLADIHG